MDARRKQELEAFEAAWSQHYSAVLRFCVRRVGDRQAALDAAAETFLVAWRRVGELPAQPLPWLYGIARLTLANQQRGDRRRRALIARLGADRGGAGPAAASELGQRAVEAFNRLRAEQREVLALSIWEELRPREAARVLGISAPTYSVRLHRARRALREQLESDRCGAAELDVKPIRPTEVEANE